MIELYLASAYAYYILDEPLVSDEEFDLICKDILSNYYRYRKHPFIKYVKKEALKCNGYLGDYPNIIDILYKTFLKKG